MILKTMKLRKKQREVSWGISEDLVVGLVPVSHHPRGHCWSSAKRVTALSTFIGGLQYRFSNIAMSLVNSYYHRNNNILFNY